MIPAPANPSNAERLARQLGACMTGGKLFTRQMMEQMRDELRRLDLQTAPMQAMAESAKAKRRKAGDL